MATDKIKVAVRVRPFNRRGNNQITRHVIIIIVKKNLYVKIPAAIGHTSMLFIDCCCCDFVILIFNKSPLKTRLNLLKFSEKKVRLMREMLRKAKGSSKHK